MDVGDVVPELRYDRMGVYDTLVDVRNNGASACDVVANVRDHYVCVYRKFGLEIHGQRSPYKIGRTHVEDMKDPVEVRFPGGNHLLIILRVEMSRDHISLAPLHDVPLDLGHSPAIESSAVSEIPDVCIAGSTHTVNCSIASTTE